MPDSTVQQVGGDFTSLAAALADAGTGSGDTITIQGVWTIDDTTAAIGSDDDITIQIIAGNASYHNGVYNEANNHYRLVNSVNGSHCIQMNNTGCLIDGLAIVQNSTGSSDEGIRNAANTLTIRRCIIRATNVQSDQDGFYSAVVGTINAENCFIYGFARAGIHGQIAAGTLIINVDSCSCWNNSQSAGEPDGGGIGILNGGAATYNINAFNQICVGNATAFSDDYNESGSGGIVIWNIHNSIDSDGSITVRDPGAVDPLDNRTPTDNPSPGVGDFVIFTDITTSPFNLLLQDNADDNDAQDAHSALSGAGLTLPILDITDEIRDRGPNTVDIGADAVLSPATLPDYGQLRSDIGNPSVYGATILRS